MAKERVVYFNGEIIPESQAKVPIRDSGFLLGDAVFDLSLIHISEPTRPY